MPNPLLLLPHADTEGWESAELPFLARNCVLAWPRITYWNGGFIDMLKNSEFNHRSLSLFLSLSLSLSHTHTHTQVLSHSDHNQGWDAHFLSSTAPTSAEICQEESRQGSLHSAPNPALNPATFPAQQNCARCSLLKPREGNHFLSSHAEQSMQGKAELCQTNNAENPN